MKPKLHPITIIQDTREQRPLDFSPFPSVSVEVAKLWPGDYSVKGYEKSIAFERKSVADLIGTLKNGYNGYHAKNPKRFNDELRQFSEHFDRAFIIVEPDEMQTVHEAATMKHLVQQLPTHQPTAHCQIDRALFRSMMPNSNIWDFICSAEVEWGLHVYLAASREDAADYIVKVARYYIDCRRQVVRRDAPTPSAKSSTQLPPWD